MSYHSNSFFGWLKAFSFSTVVVEVRVRSTTLDSTVSPSQLNMTSVLRIMLAHKQLDTTLDVLVALVIAHTLSTSRNPSGIQG